MRRTLRHALFCVCALLICTQQAHTQGARTFYFVRHADKLSEDTDAPLSDAGHRRAECLANMLSDAHIGKIYTSDLQRTRQTAAPLAEKLQLKPVAIPLSKPDKLIAALRSEKTPNVLVVWHGTTLPGIMHALGGPVVAPIENPEYDRFFILTLSGNKKPSDVRFAALRYCDCANAPAK